MDKSFNMKLTKRYSKAFKDILQEDKQLAAEIKSRIDLLQSNSLNQLELDNIKRKNGKHKIKEIIIKNPKSYRVFYVYLKIDGDEILLVDGRKKKVNKFPNKYFEDLDKAIDQYIEENY